MTLWGRIEFSVFVAPKDGRHRRVAVIGRAGTSIVDDLAEIEEFGDDLWSSDMLSGQIGFAALQQTAGRRAILRDREAFPVFVDAVRAVEQAVRAAVERIAREVDTATTDRLADEVRRIFGRVLRELSDLDNPMRAPIGTELGEGALLSPEQASRSNSSLGSAHVPVAIDELIEPAEQPVPRARLEGAKPSGVGGSRLPTISPDPTPGMERSRFDVDAGVVLYNESHPDYLSVKDSDALLLDYFTLLVAKEYVIYNHPRAEPASLGEEMVRILARVRRHLPKRG